MGGTARDLFCNSCRNIKNQSYYSYTSKIKIKRTKIPRSLEEIETRRIKTNATNRKWREQNREKWSAINRLQQHKRRALGPIHSTEWIAKVAMLKNECQICFKTEPEIKITIDHIIPVSKGGTNHISNLQPLCMRCNQMKHNRILKIQFSTISVNNY